MDISEEKGPEDTQSVDKGPLEVQAPKISSNRSVKSQIKESEEKYKN